MTQYTKAVVSSALVLTSVCTVNAIQYHVSANGADSNPGSQMAPFRTIQHAADAAMPGDVVTVHEGIFREQISPPRGGESDEKRIVYQASPGEKVIIKGSEVVTDWKPVQGNVWKAVLPNSFFGDFNPFDDLIWGNWFKDKGRDHHTGAVYLDGDWLSEAAEKEELFAARSEGKSRGGNLLNLAWMQIGTEENKVPASAHSELQGGKLAPSKEGGDCIGFIKSGHWAKYSDVDFGANTEHMEFRVASASQGGLIEVRLDSPQGSLLAECTVPSTGGWQSWRSIKTTILPTSGRKTICLIFKEKAVQANSAPLWFAEVDEKNTTIWAQFEGVDPNQKLIEVNARQSVFYPKITGVNYITVRGFILEQAAAPWAPPTAEQIGLIGTHWSKGWVIEDNTIRYSSCVGITLGKYGDEFDNGPATADAYNKTVERAATNNWNKATVGSHMVRNNHIYQCEQAGIVGSLGAVFSTIHNNEIHDIHRKNLYAGFETAAIKFHAPIDCVISANHIYRSGNGGGIWLDWMAQGTRVSGNLLHDNSIDLFLEVNHGPILVDNNIFLSSTILDWSQGVAFAHNLFAGTIKVDPQQRETPFHRAHSTEVVGLSPIAGGDQRFLNNIFVNEKNLDMYDAFSDSVTLGGNIFLTKKATLQKKSDGVYLVLGELPSDGGKHLLVTSDLLGRTTVSNQPFEDKNGQPYAIDSDYFGNKRNKDDLHAGPFARTKKEKQVSSDWKRKIR